MLTRWKCQVTTALNGLSGFEERSSHCGKKSFDLCLMDLHMPMCDGFQCVRMIREWEKSNNIPPIAVCALTADANPDTEEQCLSGDGGFNYFLSKPLRKNVLKDMVTQICGADRMAGETVPAPSSMPKMGNDSALQVPDGASHCLVVDDAPTMRLLLRTFLTGMGCFVSEASSGESAVELVRASLADEKNSKPIEMIVCDVRMPPGIDGIETSRRIKEIAGAEAIPIIGMTADDVSNAALREAKAVGMVSLVSKPLGRVALANFLAEHTGTLVKTSIEHGTEGGVVFDEELALENCSGDKELLKTLLSEVANDLKGYMDNVRTAVQRKDSARVAEISHNIKGMAGTCGFMRLANVAKACQDCASRSDYVETRTRAQVVLEEILQAAKFANQYYP